MKYNPIHHLAQVQLKELGYYKGDLDGKWGPMSKAALKKWQAAQKPATTTSTPPVAADPYSEANRHIGTKEIPGKRHNNIIVRWLRACASWVNNDETAWCSAFVNHCARATGYELTGKLNARSWLNVGKAVSREMAKPGDVVVLWRVSPRSWKGHVAFLHHFNEKTGKVYLLGGNQNNMVNVSGYPASRILSIRRLRTLEQLEGKHSTQL